MKLDDLELVRRQYETEAGLALRRNAVTRFREGRDAADAALLPAPDVPFRSWTVNAVFVAEKDA